MFGISASQLGSIVAIMIHLLRTYGVYHISQKLFHNFVSLIYLRASYSERIRNELSSGTLRKDFRKLRNELLGRLEMNRKSSERHDSGRCRKQSSHRIRKAFSFRNLSFLFGRVNRIDHTAEVSPTLKREDDFEFQGDLYYPCSAC